MSVRIATNADVAEDVGIGEGSSIWQLAQIREGAILGCNCVVGRGAYVGAGVQIGDNVKIQNYALVYEPARLDQGVFIGPAVILTNDHYPRAVNPDGSPKSGKDWEPVGVTVLQGASVGAGAICVAPVTIGRWAMVAAGATVVGDVPDFALVVGVPARRVGWVGRAGTPLEPASGEPDLWVCTTTGARYRQVNDDRLEEC